MKRVNPGPWLAAVITATLLAGATACSAPDAPTVTPSTNTSAPAATPAPTPPAASDPTDATTGSIQTESINGIFSLEVPSDWEAPTAEAIEIQREFLSGKSDATSEWTLPAAGSMTHAKAHFASSPDDPNFPFLVDSQPETAAFVFGADNVSSTTLEMADGTPAINIRIANLAGGEQYQFYAIKDGLIYSATLSAIPEADPAALAATEKAFASITTN